MPWIKVSFDIAFSSFLESLMPGVPGTRNDENNCLWRA